MKVIAVLFACFVAGCVAPETPSPASKETKAYVNKQYLQCEHAAIARFDDGISDAQIVAAAVFRSCRSEAYQAANVYASELLPDARTNFLNKVPETFLQTAIDGVLLSRSKKSK